MEENSPNNSENKNIKDEFVQFLKDIVKDPSLIDNKEHVKSMLNEIYNYSIEHNRLKKDQYRAQEILDRIRGNQNEPSAIHPEDVDAAFVDGVNEGKRLGREAVRSMSKLFSSEDWVDNYSDVDRGER